MLERSDDTEIVDITHLNGHAWNKLGYIIFRKMYLLFWEEERSPSLPPIMALKSKEFEKKEQCMWVYGLKKFERGAYK